MTRIRKNTTGQQQATKFTITTLGCKVNQYESEAIAQQLKNTGNSQVHDTQTADFCIINTCAVTQKASMQSRQAVRQAIRSNPNAQIIVTGCYAQTEPGVINKIEGVHQIIGHAYKHQISELIRVADKKNRFASPTIKRSRFIGHNFEASPTAVFGHRTRPFLKIQDGCDSQCTYCIVPYARGPGRSMPVENVLKHIRQLNQAGYHEVILSGIHLGTYGKDLRPETDLFSLLQQIYECRPIHRVRLSSIEPLELTDDIIGLVAETDQFCQHFHIPLQSGDDNVLRKMNRPYTRSFFKDLILKINGVAPEAAIGVDILVGFPGETESAFNKTYALVKDLPVTYLHVFPFSSRKGTPASKFPEKIPSTVIKSRSQKMRRLGEFKKRCFYNKFIGEKIDALMEDKKETVSGCLKGVTSNYIPVLVTWDDRYKNTLVQVRIEALNTDNTVFGNIC